VFYPYFGDAGFNIVATVCQYGNLHFSTLNEETDTIFNKVLTQTGLYISTNNDCGAGRIAGRIMVNK